MMTSYLPDQMLRNLAAQPVTDSLQREMDAQLGSAVAAASRRTSRASRHIQSSGRRPGAGRSLAAFRKAAAGQSSSCASVACR